MKHKNITLITLALGIGTLFSACSDYLDSDKYFEDRLTIEKVFSSRVRSQQWLAYAYSFLKDEKCRRCWQGERNQFVYLCRRHVLWRPRCQLRLQGSQ